VSFRRFTRTVTGKTSIVCLGAERHSSRHDRGMVAGAHNLAAVGVMKRHQDSARLHRLNGEAANSCPKMILAANHTPDHPK